MWNFLRRRALYRKIQRKLRHRRLEKLFRQRGGSFNERGWSTTVSCPGHHQNIPSLCWNKFSGVGHCFQCEKYYLSTEVEKLLGTFRENA